MAHDEDDELEQEVEEALADYKVRQEPLEKLLNRFANLANGAIGAFRIKSEFGVEEYVVQLDSHTQVKVTLESLIAYKDSPWNH